MVFPTLRDTVQGKTHRVTQALKTLIMLLDSRIFQPKSHRPRETFTLIIFFVAQALTLSGPGGGGSEARMTKLTADNQKPLTL